MIIARWLAATLMRLRRLDDVAALARARLFVRRYWPTIVVAVVSAGVYAGSLLALAAEQAGCHR